MTDERLEQIKQHIDMELEMNEKLTPRSLLDKLFQEKIELYDEVVRLKQENERLKDNRDWWKDRFFGQQEYDDSHRITAIEYKKRMDKAIEYINKHFEDNEGIICKIIDEHTCDANYNFLEDLINILQNGSDGQ